MAILYRSFNFLTLWSLVWTVLAADIELKPIRPGDWTGQTLRKRDPSSLQLQNYETFLWQVPDGGKTVLGNFTVYTPGDTEHILAMEKFEDMLKSVKCTPTALTLEFIDDTTFEYAKKVWDWVNGADDHSFLMVAAAGQCGNNTYRTPYMVHSLKYDEGPNIAHLTVTTGKWETLVHSYELRLGKVTPPASSKLIRRKDGDDSTAFSLAKPFDFKVKVEATPLAGELACVGCELTGSLDVDMHVAFGIPDIIDKATFKMQPKGISASINPSLTVTAKTEDKTEWKHTLYPAPIPIYGITLGGFMRLGFFSDFIMGLESTAFDGSITVATGWKATIPDSAFVEVDFRNLGDGIKSSSWMPTFSRKPLTITGKVSMKAQLFIAPTIKLEASALDFGYEGELELKMPTYDMEATYQTSPNGGMCDDGDDVTNAINFQGQLGAEIAFVAGKLHDSTPLEWTIGHAILADPQKKCYALTHKAGGGGGGGGAKSSAPPSPTKSKAAEASNPPASTPTCKSNAGLSGTCISTSSCNNLGGNSEAGHCPGAANIQCCTFSEGSGDTCSANGVSGTCMPTSSCPSSTGVSIPGHCRGPTDIQCCVSKEVQQQATAKNVCTISKAGLSNSGFVGECITTSNCKRLKGTSTPGFCPGGSDVQCCTYGTCEGKPGVCEPVSTCTGTKTPGLCPGGSNIQCCSKDTGNIHPGVE
ncbi:hypothetical protein BCR34DRAFT_332991 [Clohesyomyces aquaticus]|uniref:Uncharacterized protein n=1 Tax=Clohesyomyces aquaticus TaxID=1231657 RepID=A0A1Y1ZLH7_9PLEO|nr:hypothetical protein BCR34DRAFT_332991 [Clohesyomyces aquaticus]